jgi:general secretion pathway protein G
MGRALPGLVLHHAHPGRTEPASIAFVATKPRTTSPKWENDMLDQIREARKNQKGFTLIELLIVIVILGVLAAIVVFAVGAFNGEGKTAACKSDFKNVEIASEAYYAKTHNIPASVNVLKPTYLKDVPNSPDYSITVGSDSGTPPETKVSVTVGTTTSTDNSACDTL